MKLDAEFVSSAFTSVECPSWNRVEVAIAGRSNVGKSSILNALCARKDLARTSKTPGRTRCLNFFAVGNRFALVDLPGYGYAKMPRAEAHAIAKLMNDFLAHRENLVALVLLIDSRRGPEREEVELARMIEQRNTELVVVATKADKLRNSERRTALGRFQEMLGVQPIMCSAENGDGIDELRRRILGCVKGASKRPSNATLRAVAPLYEP